MPEDLDIIENPNDRLNLLATEVPFQDLEGEILRISSGTHCTVQILEDVPYTFVDEIIKSLDCKTLDEVRQKVSSLKTYRELRDFIAHLNDKVLNKIDPELSEHHTNVARLAKHIAAMAFQSGMISKEQFIFSHLAAYLHDIGKLAIPNHIAKSEEVYGPLEHEKMHEHPFMGYAFAKMLDFPQPIANTILKHHERKNGKGYPMSIENVPPPAQILGLADTMWSMLEDRKYRNGSSRKDFIIAELIKAKEGNQFDPALVDICIKIAESWLLNPPIPVPPENDS